MSDYYQILKREVAKNNNDQSQGFQNNVPESSKKAVENFDNKQNVIPKRIKTVKTNLKKVKKISTARKTKTRRASRADESYDSFLNFEPFNPIWLTMAETAKLSGVQKITIKRAVRAGQLKYRIIESRYQVDLRSALLYLHSKRKLWHKLLESGLGQYVEKWRQ